MKRSTWLGLGLSAVLLAGPALADNEMSAAEKAMMEACMAAATPGAAHQHLATMVGSWDATVKMWMDPTASPTESKGTSEMAMVLGGRYLYQTFQGEMMGMPFEGMGYTGYDNVQKKYVGIWMDSMSTGVMTSVGEEDPATKKITMKGSFWDPVSGAPMEVEEVMTVVDANHHVFEMWAPGPDGKKFKTMEMHYTRKM